MEFYGWLKQAQVDTLIAASGPYSLQTWGSEDFSRWCRVWQKPAGHGAQKHRPACQQTVTAWPELGVGVTRSCESPRLTWEEENPAWVPRWEPAVSESVSLSKCTQAPFISLALECIMLRSQVAWPGSWTYWLSLWKEDLFPFLGNAACGGVLFFSLHVHWLKMCALSMFSTQAHTQNVHVVKMHLGEVYPWHCSR